MPIDLTVREALDEYLEEVAASRSENTHRAYAQACDVFAGVLAENGQPPTQTLISSTSVEWMSWFIHALRDYAIATEQLYITAVAGFYEYVAAEAWAEINLPALKKLRHRRARREPTRLPPFPRDEIEEVLDTVDRAATIPTDDDKGRLRNLRDRALLFVLADTGLRVAEACSLSRGDIDWNEGRAVVLGKGNREAVVRFSQRSLRKVRAYLRARAELDGIQRRALSSLAVFARHDRGAGRKVLPISTRSAEKIVERWVVSALGAKARGTITPHTFRHYFVTTVLRASGGNIRLAQELARHESIVTTQRYTHLSDDELDRDYHDIFDS